MDVREMARLGGLARAQNLTPAERRASALKASRAAAKARSEKARERKAQQLRPASNLASELKKKSKPKRNRKHPLGDVNAEIRKSR